MLLSLARLITAALLIASAAAFATGAAIERHTASSERPLAQQEQHPAAGAEGEKPASEEGATSGESSAMHTAEHSSENLLGINPEATGLVVIAVVMSLLLATLILTVRSPLVAAGVALVMLAFTALDIREVTHQLHESHQGLAALAAAIAALHLAAGAGVFLAAARPDPTRAKNTYVREDQITPHLAALAILLASQVHPAGHPHRASRLTGPAQAGELIDHLRSSGRTLTFDPKQWTLRTDTKDAVTVAVGRSR